jgi:hypothetical protein
VKDVDDAVVGGSGESSHTRIIPHYTQFKQDNVKSKSSVTVGKARIRIPEFVTR